ncbi:MAG TPA: DoxX family membrane protein [Gammaproteobacteria bacterium]|jgi:uncharacterized membrane protein|nr:DoxX family membrane protein [Gammaproteobacteria bacterium]
MRIVSPGHAVFAATLVAIGIVGLVRPEYAAIWNGVPKDFPARGALPYLCALVAIACGLGLLWPRTAAPAARVLLAWLLAWMLLFKGRFILLAPLQEGSYQSIGENAVIVAGAWVLFAWFATDWDRRQLGFATGERGLRIARTLYGLALIAFGLSHFFYLQFTAPLIPGWLLWPVFWAYFTGTTYLAAGVAVLTGVWARLAATLVAVQMGSFLLLVWLPVFLAGKMTDFNWGEVTATCALAAAGWVVAESYRGVPWLAVGKR